MAYEFDFTDLDLYANKNFAKLMSDRNRYIISYGGRDGGKSYNIAQKIIFNILSERYCKAVLLRKIGADIKDSQFKTILSVIEDWKLENYFNYIKHPLEITCTLNNNIIIARGLDKPTKLKSIKDPSLVWIEEANEISYEDFMTTNLSIRSNIKDSLLQMILSFNPENENCWINKFFFPPSISYQNETGDYEFVQSQKPSTTILHSTYINNKYCSQQNKEDYKNLKYNDKDYYDVALLGLWGNIDNTKIFKEIYYKDKFPEPEERKSYGIGLDFGFTNDPTAIIECCIAHGEIWLRELCYKRGLVNTTEDKEQQSIDKELQRCGIIREEIFADSAEPKSIRELQLKKWNISGVSKEKDSVESGLNSLKKYKINVINSPNLKKEFFNYSYKKDKEGNITNIPIDAFNHGIDAIRYWYRGAVQEPKKLICEVF